MSKSFTTRCNNPAPEQRSYVLQSLALHLYQADDYDHLHGLMIEDWMRVRSAYDEHYAPWTRLPRYLFSEAPADLAPYLPQSMMRDALEIVEDS